MKKLFYILSFLIFNFSKLYSQNPVVDVGQGKIIKLPLDSITLHGSATPASGSSIQSYIWTKQSGPNVNPKSYGQGTEDFYLKNLVAGSYIFRLTVTDSKGLNGFSEVSLDVKPAHEPPVIDLGNDRVVIIPSPTSKGSVSIFGSAYDPQGPAIASYFWTQISGPSTATLSGTTTNFLSAKNLIQGTYVFNLLAKDNTDAYSNVSIKVLVSSSSTANLPPKVTLFTYKREISLPIDSTSLRGAAFSQDVFFYKWVQVDGPDQATLTNKIKDKVLISNLHVGKYKFVLTATSYPYGAVGYSDTALVIVHGIPIVNAGKDTTIVWPNISFTLNGSVSDPEGKIISTTWSELSGKKLNWTGQNTLSPNLQELDSGIYIFRLIATNDKGATGFSDVKVILRKPDISGLKPRKIFAVNLEPFWEIEDIQTFPQYKVFVINEQGQTVYSTLNYSLNPWSGNLGKDIKEGAYFYIIRDSVSNKNVSTGSLLVIR